MAELAAKEEALETVAERMSEVAVLLLWPVPEEMAEVLGPVAEWMAGRAVLELVAELLKPVADEPEAFLRAAERVVGAMSQDKQLEVEV